MAFPKQTANILSVREHCNSKETLMPQLRQGRKPDSLLDHDSLIITWHNSFLTPKSLFRSSCDWWRAPGLGRAHTEWTIGKPRLPSSAHPSSIRRTARQPKQQSNRAIHAHTAWVLKVAVSSPVQAFKSSRGFMTYQRVHYLPQAPLG